MTSRLITSSDVTLGGFGILAKSGTAVPLTGSTSETALATIAIAASAVGANGVIHVRTFWSMPSSGNQKSMRLRLGAAALAGTVVSSVAGTTIANADIETTIRALNATNSQSSMSKGPRGTDYLVSGGVATSSAIDMTAAQNIVITGQLASSGETLTLLGYLVQVAK